jgi:hypothetical protein
MTTKERKLKGDLAPYDYLIMCSYCSSTPSTVSI